MNNDDDKFHDECGIFGILGHEDAAALIALGLHALQHRGQEACGIVTVDDKGEFSTKRALGLVDKTFGRADTLARLKGAAGIGHNRYATSGATVLRNVQPLYADLAFGGFALAHNGNLTNAQTLRKDLVENGAIFQSSSDTETIIHLMATQKGKRVIDRLTYALQYIKGGYSLIALATDKMIGVRDPHGIRPLLLGKLNNSYVLASESCAFDIIGAETVRDIAPGEMVVITEQGVQSHMPFPTKSESRFCVFEHVYFARPDSVLEEQSVYQKRKQIGVELAHEAPVADGDVVVPVPDSGVPSAIGFAEASNIPFELGIIRNHYVGRTFIEPGQKIRNLGVRLKHNANRAMLEGKNVVLVDDSIVRGTTSRKIVEMVRAAGAKSVHMRITSPPTKYPCFYGIDTPSSEELLAHSMSTEDIAKQIGADSLAYVSLDGLYRAMGKADGRNPAKPAYCDACFSGDYPVELIDFEMKNCSGEKISKLEKVL
jgi:amidophosphoribosyltransferase